MRITIFSPANDQYDLPEHYPIPRLNDRVCLKGNVISIVSEVLHDYVSETIWIKTINQPN